eukprot:jgi/Undpi1/11265/HiC_scaffold_30.g13563.m1
MGTPVRLRAEGSMNTTALLRAEVDVAVPARNTGGVEYGVNDDYCDCFDGTDETLTPACSHKGHSRFRCLETGPLNQTIPTSRVWDGVCDCCDGSDERQEGEGGGSWPGWATPCDRNGCAALLEGDRARAEEAYRRVKVGLERRPAEEERGRQALARWQATLATEEISEGIRKEEREAVTKLEVLLKVYLQDEERTERKERAQLAAAGRCNSGADGKGRAAALGPCENNAEEREAAEKVRAARAVARARRDTEEAEILDKAKKAKRNRNRNKNKNTDKKMRDRKAGAHKVAGSGSGGSSSGSGSDTRTAQDILNLHWPLEIAAGTALASSSDEDAKREEEGGEREEEEGRRGGEGGGKGAEVGLSLREYVARRQQGSAAAKGGDVKQAEEKKAEELRKTAVLGPVLNDGERGVYLGLTVLLRMVGLPLLSPFRGLLVACEFARRQLSKAMAALAVKFGLPSPVQASLEGYRDRGLPGISPYLDYRRYPTLRSLVLHWDQFLDGNGKFLVVMWDAPIALWDFLFPELDVEHERPEAAMLREGIAQAKASLESRKADAEGGGGGKGSRGRGRRKEETEAKRLSGLDLGERAEFAALAEECLELHEGDVKQDRHSLGKWRRWGPGDGGGGGGRRSMLYDGGSRCHNSKLRCVDAFLSEAPKAFHREGGEFVATLVEGHLSRTSVVIALARVRSGSS